MAQVIVKQMSGDTDEELIHGEANVTVAGSAEIMADNIPAYWIKIQAKRTNQGVIYIGGNDVPNNDTGGIMLNAEDTIELWIKNLNQLYINSTVDDEGVIYIAWQA